MSYVENLLGPPSVSGAYIISSAYQVMGVGSTDRIFLLGHADGLTINDPYLVTDLQAAINLMNKDSSSPLIRALLECYYGGARDIFLVAVAPMSEYVADPTQRTDSWYSNYAAELQTAYGILQYWDPVQIIVPLNAPYNCDIDFLTPLAQHCYDSLNSTGVVRIGVMGTLKGSPLTQGDIDGMVADPRLSPGYVLNYDVGLYGQGPYGGVGTYINSYVSIGQFVSVFVGEGAINISEMPGTYTNSLIGPIAGQIAQQNVSDSIVNKSLPLVVDILGVPSNAQLVEMANAGLNPLTKTTVGKRGKPFQVIAATDNTLAPTGSDFWSINVFRSVGKIANYVSNLGSQNLGGVAMGQYQAEINNYMNSLKQAQRIRSFTLDVGRDPKDRYNVIVNLTITPYSALRTISFSVVVGPGA